MNLATVTAILNIYVGHETSGVVGFAHAVTFLAEISVGAMESTANFFSAHRRLSRENGSVFLVLLPEWLQHHSVFSLRCLNEIEQIFSGVVGRRAIDTTASDRLSLVIQVTLDQVVSLLLTASWLESLRSGRGMLVVVLRLQNLDSNGCSLRR